MPRFLFRKSAIALDSACHIERIPCQLLQRRSAGCGKERASSCRSLTQDSDEEYEAALEKRRLEVEAEKRVQQEEDARLVRAATAQQELPGGYLSCIRQPYFHTLYRTANS